MQNAVDFKDLGIATSSNTFFRSLGGAFGTAIFGTILNNRVSHNLSTGFADLATTNPAILAGVDQTQIASLRNSTAGLANLPIEVQNVVLNGFANAFHVVFLSAAPIMFVGFLFSLFLREKPLQSGADHATAKHEAAGEALG